MAKVLPFVPTPAPAPTPRPPRGLSFTLRIDADELAAALVKRLKKDEASHRD